MDEPDEREMPQSQWNHLVSKMRRRGDIGAGDALVDMVAQSIGRSNFEETELSAVTKDEADLFLYTRSLSSGEETLEGYREDQRWMVAEHISDRIQGGEDIFVVVGDLTELDMVETCREALAE